MFVELLYNFRDIITGPNLSERRITPRALCNIPLSCQASDGATLCTLKDLSSTGARILSDRKFARKRVLLLAPPKGMGESSKSVKTQVAWCRSTREGYLIGLRFPTSGPSGWILTLLRELGLTTQVPTQQRKFVRVPSDLNVKFQSQGFEKSVRLQDLSIGGALLRVRDKVPDGEAVRMILPAESDLPELPLLAVSCGCKPSSSGYDLALKFADLNDKQRKVIVKYLSFLMRRSLAR